MRVLGESHRQVVLSSGVEWFGLSSIGLGVVWAILSVLGWFGLSFLLSKKGFDFFFWLRTPPRFSVP